MNNHEPLVNDDGALTEEGYALLRETESTFQAFRAHWGGRLHAWFRLMSRNSYTIDPRKPEADERDEEKDALGRKADELIMACIKGGVMTVSGASHHWGWVPPRG